METSIDFKKSMIGSAVLRLWSSWIYGVNDRDRLTEDGFERSIAHLNILLEKYDMSISNIKEFEFQINWKDGKEEKNEIWDLRQVPTPED